MTLNKFIKEYNGAPYELRDFAVAAKDVKHTQLKEAAEAFLEAQEDFISILNNLGVELG